MNRLTLEEKIKIVRLYSENGKNVCEVRQRPYQLGILEGGHTNSKNNNNYQ